MELCKVIEVLTKFEARIKSNPDSLRPEITKVTLECDDDIIFTIKDKNSKATD